MIDSLRRQFESRASKYGVALDRGSKVAAYLLEKLSPSQILMNPELRTLQGTTAAFWVEEPDMSVEFYLKDIPNKYWDELISPVLHRYAKEFDYELIININHRSEWRGLNYKRRYYTHYVAFHRRDSHARERLEVQP